MPVLHFIEEMVKKSESQNPFELATIMMTYPTFESHSCQNAWVFTASILTAVKNEGTVKLPVDDILNALKSIEEQTDPKLVSSTGVCGVAPAVGLAFHAIFSAVYGKNAHDDMTMHVVEQAIGYITDNSNGCRCCKRVVLTILDLVSSLIRARFGVDLEGSVQHLVCNQVETTGHCDPLTCQYSVLLNN